MLSERTMCKSTRFFYSKPLLGGFAAPSHLAHFLFLNQKIFRLIFTTPLILNFKRRKQYSCIRNYFNYLDLSKKYIIDEIKGKQMANSEDKKYQEAIATLNSLQSNASVIENARKARKLNPSKNLIYTRHYLDSCGVKQCDLKKINIIHLAGTKGKGSTAAFTESILRSHGLKTGFYSSPHLVVVRERIRINGTPLSKQAFTSSFWLTYNLLKQNAQESEKNEIPILPPYFRFMTVMALRLFIKEEVDVGIIEVGLGGEYDCTNVIDEPTVVGITSLGIDHVAILGDTIDKIAWQKAGIFKKHVAAFTVKQKEEAMKVLEERAKEKQCTLFVVPPLESYSFPDGQNIKLGIPGEVQKLNASLALQLSKAWLDIKFAQNIPQANSYGTLNRLEPFDINEKYLKGLSNCTWPGRYQKIVQGSVTYFLDGAHTLESIEICRSWFVNESITSNNNKTYRIMLFNCTGQRNIECLLNPLAQEEFDVAVFSPNSIESCQNKSLNLDQSNFTITLDKEIENVDQLSAAWDRLYEKYHGCQTKTLKHACLKDALECIRKLSESESEAHVLVTGSLHLVGGVLSLIDPNMDCLKPRA